MSTSDAASEPDPVESETLPLAGRLRAALCAFVDEAGTRRSLPVVFHVGIPGGRPDLEQVAVPHALGTDASLRGDLADRALSRLSARARAEACPWVTRSGGLHATDPDLQWLAAAYAAFGRHGCEWPGFFVITRHGWINLSTEESVRWARFRRR